MSPEAAYDAIVIGAGHNGLVTAAYLARAGRRVVVLERREKVGGILETVEVAPGVRAPGIVHTVGRLRRSVIEDLGLERHGFVLIDPPVRVFAPQPDGSGLTLWADPARSAEDLRARSPHDAEAYPRFDARVRALASFLAYLYASTPPDVKGPSFADAVSGVRIGNAFRRLGRRASREATRAMPMAIADYVAESLETDPVRGAIASRAVQFTGGALGCGHPPGMGRAPRVRSGRRSVGGGQHGRAHAGGGADHRPIGRDVPAHVPNQPGQGQSQGRAGVPAHGGAGGRTT
jgi:phytoene dehydrogenase-like protein